MFEKEEPDTDGGIVSGEPRAEKTFPKGGVIWWYFLKIVQNLEERILR